MFCNTDPILIASPGSLFTILFQKPLYFLLLVLNALFIIVFGIQIYTPVISYIQDIDCFAINYLESQLSGHGIDHHDAHIPIKMHTSRSADILAEIIEAKGVVKSIYLDGTLSIR